jgi:hypothetical protein
MFKIIKSIIGSAGPRHLRGRGKAGKARRKAQTTMWF